MSEYEDLLARVRGSSVEPAAVAAEPQESEEAQLLRQVRGQTKSVAQASVYDASYGNPDEEAKKRRVSQLLQSELGDTTPPDLIDLNDADRRLKQAQAYKAEGKTAEFLANPDNAKIAYDDAQNLSNIEKYIKDGLVSGRASKGVIGGQKYVAPEIQDAEDKSGRWTGLATGSAVKGFWGTNVGIAGAAAAPFEVTTQGLQAVGMPEWMAKTELGSLFRSMAESAQARQKSVDMPTPEGNLEAGVSSGVQSLIQNVLTLPAGVATKSYQAFAGLMSAIAGGQSYVEATEAGKTPVQGVSLAIPDAAAEYVTELYAGKALFDIPGVQSGAKAILKGAANFASKEIISEEIATAWQDFNKWMVMNPEKTLDDYLAERPDAAIQTAIATIVGGGGQIALMTGVNSLVERGQKAQEAQQFSETISGLNQLAQASKVLERSQDTAQEFFQSVLEEHGSAAEVWISPKALFQSGLEQRMIEAIPEIQQQIADAKVGNHDIRVPVAPLMAKMAGQEVDILAPLVSQEPGGFSQAEAAEYIQSGAAQELQETVERYLTAKNSDDAFRQSQEAVKAQILDEMNSVGRFTPQKNEADATLISSYYAVRAAQSGVTPEQLYARRKVGFAAESMGGKQQLEQAEFTAADDFLTAFDVAPTIDIQAPQRSEEEIDNDQASFLSVFPKGSRYTRDTGLLKRVRKSSDVAANELRGNPAATRVNAEPLGPFSQYETRAVVLPGDSFNPGGRIEIQVFGKEQVEQGLTDTPALTITVTDNGELSLNGPDKESKEFAEFKKLGWADHATGFDGVQQTGWTTLKNPENPNKPLPIKQLITLLADVHARVKEWKMADHVGLHWSRATGALGGLFDQDQSAVYFQKVIRGETAIPESVVGDALTAAREVQDASNAADISEEIRSIEANGDVDASQLANDPKYWDAENEEFTAAGREEYDRLKEEKARDNLRLPNITEMSDLDRAFYKAQYAAMKAILDGMGIEYTDTSSSQSKYLEVAGVKLRFADHANQVRDSAIRGSLPVINVAPGENTFIEAVNSVLQKVSRGGTPLKAVDTESAGFKAWFGDSKVVDAEGKPLVVYHGTTSSFDTFDPEYGTKVDPGWLGLGSYFTDSIDTANSYTRIRPAGNSGENVMPVYLSIRNPLRIEGTMAVTKSQAMAQALGIEFKGLNARNRDQAEQLRDAAIAAGYDGVVYQYAHGKREREYVAFRPEQIKSASSNTGAFDPNDPNILHQAAYHGTPHKFDKFTLDHIGTGEGAQAYGFGLYFAGERETAEFYREKLSDSGGRGLGLAGVVPSSPNEGLSNAAWVSAKKLSELLVSKSGAIKSFGDFDIKGRSDVLAVMGSLLQDDKVLNAVVGLVPIDVVNVLAEKQYAPEYLLDHPSMLIYLLPKDANDLVPGSTDAINVLASAVAIAAAKVHTGLGRFDVSASDFVTASGTLVHDVSPVVSGKIPHPSEFSKGQLYEVEIPEDDAMLLWDKPLSEQPEKVRNAIYNSDITAIGKNALGWRGAPEGMHEKAMQRMGGEQFYRDLSESIKGDEAASKYLNSLGIVGIKYLDGQSRNRPLREIKREFLAELPEDADFTEVADLLGTGIFSPANEAIIKALQVDDWLGFDYPAQALSAALGGELSNLDASQALKDSVEAARDGSTYNYVIFDEDAIKILNTYYQGQGNRGAFNPETLTIAALKGADLTTILHEGSHFFFENDIFLASELIGKSDLTAGEQQIVNDVSTLLTWHGIKGTPEDQLRQWFSMDFEERRTHHERTAESFEKYLFEGRAPSIELQPYFQKFRAWFVSVYKTLTEFLGKNPEAGKLNDEVRGVFDRMIATEEQIKLAEQGRSMMPLFTDQKKSGMTPEMFAAYQKDSQAGTDEAIERLQAQGLRDMQWLHNARNRIVKKLQKESKAKRTEVEMEVRKEVMAQPIYQAWQFLTGKIQAEDKIAPKEKIVSDPKNVTPEVDSLFQAIAKLGGIDRAQLVSEWGLDKEEKLRASTGLGGKRVVDRVGGMSIDNMGMRLAELGYLATDKNGRYDMQEFEAKFFDGIGGTDHYSLSYDYDQTLSPTDGIIRPDAMTAGRFDIQSVEEMGLPVEMVNHLKTLKMTAKVGMPAETVADMFGFSSADELIRTLLAVDTPKDAVNKLTDARMMAEYGELATQEDIERAADKAIHNEARGKFITAEANALAQAVGKRKILVSAAKEYAAQIIAKLKVRDIRPSQYASAEVRAAKNAQKASNAGDTRTAAAEKLNQVIGHYATRAAYDAQDDVESGRRYLKKFDKRSKTLDVEYQDQIEALLERFELRPISNKDVDRRISLAKWIEAQRENGTEPDISPELENEAFRKSYKEMTVEEFRGLLDTVKQIEHLGRLKHKLLTAQEQREFAVIVDEAAASIIEHGGKSRPVELESPKGIRPWLEGFAAGHRKMASLIRQMDGLIDGGPMWRILGRGMNEAATNESTMNEKATVELAKLYKPLLAMKGGLNGDKQFIPEIRDSLTRAGRLSIALNWGNQTNRQRIMEGDGWNEYQVNAILSRLTQEEWKFVNSMWAYIDTYWPLIEAKEKRVTGRAPEKVKAEPFQFTSEGETISLAGGYYPLKYDSNRSDRSEKHDAAEIAKEMMRGAFTRSTTRRGHTKERVEGVKLPVRKSLDVITQHISEVTHDLAWHEWLIDANRLMDAKPINTAIREHYGPEVLRTMKDALTGIATADVIPQTKVDSALMYLRANVSRSTMGFSLTTAFLQPFGLTQSMVRIGPQHVLRGIARWGGDAARFENSLTWIKEKSEFMRLRSKTFNRELHEIKGRVSKGHSKARTIYDASLFMLMQKMQMVADVPTWIGAYEKALAEGKDEDTAVAMADQSVLDSQGGGQTKDMAEFQRKHPFLTMFYSYFNTTLNLAAESTSQTDFKNPLAVAGWASDMALLMVIPALAPAMILAMMRGEDCDDPEKCAKKMAQAQAGYLLNLMLGVREVSGPVSGYDYSGPPVGRVITELNKTGKQVAQGEMDEGLAKSAISLLGVTLGIPTTQILRSWRGWLAWEEGDAPASSVLLGPPQKD